MLMQIINKYKPNQIVIIFYCKIITKKNMKNKKINNKVNN